MRWVVPGVLMLAACASSATNEITTGDATAGEVTTGQVTVTPSAPAGAAPTISDATTENPATERSEPAPSSSGADAEPVPEHDDAVRPDGFATTRAIVTKADGTTCEVCVWLADTARQRSRGLMFVTDLGDGVGMAFRYPDPHTGTFVMKNTVLPLSIAFFAADGEFLSSFDMVPCTSAPCLSYPTPADFLVAVEVPQGDLGRLGLGAGSRFELLDLPCDG